MVELERNLLGTMAVKRGYLNDGELHTCVEEQYQRQWRGERIRLGQILRKRGHIDSNTLGKLLRAQRRLSSGSFGEVAVRLGTATVDEVEYALDIQSGQRNRGAADHLGQIMIDEGLLNREQVAEILFTQQEVKRVCEHCGTHNTFQNLFENEQRTCTKCGTPFRV